MDDSDVVAAIAAGDPAGLAAAYDRYAAPLYGYCRWMLSSPGPAAEALRETFAAAAGKLGGLKDPGQMRAWLYGIARDECCRQLRTAEAGLDEAGFDEAGFDEAGFDEAGFDEAGLDEAAGEGIAPEAGPEAQAEVRRLILATLADLKPQEHEVIELSVRHNLDEAELAAVLEVSWSRAHTLASQARDHLEKALDALLIARTGRGSCPELAALLAGWDGQLTVETGRLTARHVEHCETCASHRHGALRPEVLSRMLPLAELPPGLREPVLERAGQSAAAGSRGPLARRAAALGHTGFRRTLGLLSWNTIRANPGRAMAAAALTVWLAAAMSATVVTVTGMHGVRALAAQQNSASAAPVQQAATSPAAGTSAGPHHSRSRKPAAQLIPGLPPAPGPGPVPSPSRSASAKPTTSKSPSPSASASPSDSASATPTPTHSRTPTPTPTPTTPTPTPSDTTTPPPA
jgi:RNA polymerase sigma factor (sigma-70 family)